MIKETITSFGPGTAFFLNGDEIRTTEDLQEQIRTLLPLYRSGAERLPGRKGRLGRTTYIYTPVAFAEFARQAQGAVPLEDIVPAYLLSGGSPVGQSKLAREAGLANNTIAAEYVDTLADLLSVGISYPWDTNANRASRRRPAKFHFTNTLVATAWHPLHPRRRSAGAPAALGVQGPRARLRGNADLFY